MERQSAPIRRKLSTISLVSTGAALLLSLVLFLVGEIYAARSANLQQLRVLSEAIATNSSAALAFDNADDGRAVLSAFKSDPHIDAAALYKSDGSVFVTYPQVVPAGLLPQAAGAPGYHIDGAALIGVAAVREGTRELGTLYVRSNLSAVYDRVAVYAFAAAIAIALALFAAWAISRRLQAELSAPILELAGTARLVSDRRDYSVRARHPGINELDDLTNAFNHMLQQTEQNERRMSAQVNRLALLQQITHSIGSRHDLKSILQVVLRSLEEHMPIDFGCVCLCDAGSGTVTVDSVGTASEDSCRSLGLAPGSVVPVGRNGLYRAVNGTLIYEPDTATVNSPFARRFAEAGFHSMVISPLAVESNVFGVLVAVRRERAAFSSADCEFLKQLSSHVALASHEAQLYGALQRAYEDLRHSQQSVMQTERLRALGEMASGIAHDINNAISPVGLYAELLLNQEGGKLTEAGRGRLVTMRRAIDDVAGTIERMREFYRPRETTRAFTALDIHGAIAQVLELTRPRWRALPEQRGIVIELRKEFGSQLPEVMGDEVELRDALTNLVFNAVDAMPEGGTLTLRTKSGVEADGRSTVSIEVGDTGIGMDEDTRRRCIEPFFTTKGERGTGLGLASVFGMLQRHSGTLEVDSAPGKGTTMRMVFPAFADDTSTPRPNLAATTSLRKLRILVIDDDPILIRSLRDVLEADGHIVEASLGGEEGIAAFIAARGTPDAFEVVMTDLGMPRVDGRKVAEAIKQVSPSTPILLLTGWGQRLLDEATLPENIDRVLSKPPRLNLLRAALLEVTSPRDPGL
jgi:signal transduction histidine kinase/CheY-like chemotaxis protein